MAGFNPNFGQFSRTAGLRPGSRSGFQVEIKGLSDLTKKLERNIRRMEQGILRKAVNAFAEPIRADAQRRARSAFARNSAPADQLKRALFPDLPESALFKSSGGSQVEIGTNIRIRGTTADVKVGPLNEYFWLFFFEYGYWIRAERKGRPITWVAPRPTMRPAYEANKERGLKAMEEILFEAYANDSGGSNA